MADNLLPGRYAVGAASVDAGGTIVTPTGATWTDNIWGDDLFFLPSQPLVPPQRVEAVNENGEIVLAYPWPGAAATDEPYEVRFVGIIERSTAQSRRVLEQLGDVKSWADIFVATDADRRALESPTNPLPAGRRVLVIDDGLIWVKKTSAYDDWLPPAAFKGDTGNKGWSPVFGVVADGARRVLQLAGWVGGEGVAPSGVGKYVGTAGLVDDIALAIDIRGEGFQWSGAYNAANAYPKGSVTRLNGSSFIASQAVPIGEQPSGAYPPVDTPYWQVLASKGQDGTGTGDFVGPAGGVADGDLVAFDGPTGKLGKKAGGVSNAQLATMANATVKGRNTAGTGAPEDVTIGQLLSLLKAAGAFAKDNILGTVSQSGGVPTGAIVERGSNANGEYVRYADGTQICWFRGASLLSTTTSEGAFYYSAAASPVFPVAFVSVVATPLADKAGGGNNLCWAALSNNNPTLTGFTAFVMSSASSGSARLAYIAIGRWF